MSDLQKLPEISTEFIQFIGLWHEYKKTSRKIKAAKEELNQGNMHLLLDRKKDLSARMDKITTEVLHLVK